MTREFKQKGADKVEQNDAWRVRPRENAVLLLRTLFFTVVGGLSGQVVSRRGGGRQNEEQWERGRTDRKSVRE